jgi:hypothetical protein
MHRVKRTGFKSTRKQMPRKSARAASGKEPDYLAALHMLPCCICQAFGEVQLSPTQAHHTIHGRYSTRKTPDRAAIPLCEGHHQGLMDTSKVALHQQPDAWRWRYGLDTDYIAGTQEIIDNLTF